MRVLGGLLTIACGVAGAACFDVTEHRTTEPTAADPPDAGAPEVIVRRPGGTVRVAATREPVGFASYAAVWIHHEDGQDERLAISRGGEFDWSINRSGTVCRIAGTVVLVEGEPPALSWTMTTNTCNSSYQGKVANDLITAHTYDTLTLKDAEFDLAPVPYDREH